MSCRKNIHNSNNNNSNNKIMPTKVIRWSLPAWLSGSSIQYHLLPFFFRLKKIRYLAMGRLLTYIKIMQNNATYPAIFDFLAEILHMTVPIEIGRVKFGPGEILVTTQDRSEADIELELSIKEMQKLVYARRAEIFTKHTGAAP